jgi:hypothetical protein
LQSTLTLLTFKHCTQAPQSRLGCKKASQASRWLVIFPPPPHPPCLAVASERHKPAWKDQIARASTVHNGTGSSCSKEAPLHSRSESGQADLSTPEALEEIEHTPLSKSHPRSFPSPQSSRLSTSLPMLITHSQAQPSVTDPAVDVTSTRGGARIYLKVNHAGQGPLPSWLFLAILPQ